MRAGWAGTFVRWPMPPAWSRLTSIPRALSLRSATVGCRGLPWTADDYIELAASYPFRRFASLDLCTEAEIARDRDEVLDRISRTVALNHACHARAADRGIDARFMPVIQGRHPDDYLRCLEGIAGILRPGLVVRVGSMCRRALSGSDGLLAVLSRLDRVADPALRFHLFGVKGTALRHLRPLAHRVTSLDSYAYSLAARIEAWREGFSKTDEFVAGHMERWQRRQQARLDGGDAAFQHHLPARETSAFGRKRMGQSTRSRPRGNPHSDRARGDFARANHRRVDCAVGG